MIRRRTSVALLGLVLVLAAPLAVAAAGAGHGSLDPSFGKGGIVRTAISGYSEAVALVIQPDGKLVAAGNTSANRTATPSSFALARYDQNGRLDGAFGKGGTVTTQTGACTTAAAFVLQADGKLVIAGEDGGHPCRSELVRFNPDGSIDSSFGKRGKASTPLKEAFALVIQPDGRLVTAGWTGPDDARLFSLARYKPNGALDPSFGKGGLVTTPVGANGTGIVALALQRDGKLVALGPDSDGNLLLRYNRNGTLDRSFGSSGKVTTYVDPETLAIQANGKIVVAGDDIPFKAPAGTTNMFALTRFDRNGTLDRSFGKNGEVLTLIGVPEGNGSRINTLAIQADGKIVAGGYSDTGLQIVFTLVRYTPTGALDRSFGEGGIVATPIRSCCDDVKALAIQSDGNLVAAGGSWTDNTHGTFALARYRP